MFQDFFFFFPEKGNVHTGKGLENSMSIMPKGVFPALITFLNAP